MDMMPAISEAETQRRVQIREQLEQDYRAQARSRWRRLIFSGVRRLFIFLLGAALVAFIVAHRQRIDSLATQKVGGVVAQFRAKTDTADPLRQSALDHEKEVEEAAK